MHIIIHSKGKDSALNAVKMAIDSLGDEIQSAKCVIVHYACNEKYPMHDLAIANELLQERLDKDAILKQGWSFDNNLEPLQVKATLILINNCDEAELALESLIKSCESNEICDDLGESSDNDDYKERAKEIIRQSGKASISYLQRMLGVGFGKATSIIELLEKDGFFTHQIARG